jgi:preprotein translocase subunit SecF
VNLNLGHLGNDLYTGRRSVPVVTRRRRFYLGSAALIVIALLGLGTQNLNLGLEFRGGSEFRVSGASSTADYESRAREAAGAAGATTGVRVSLIGGNTVRVQTEKLTSGESAKVRTTLARQFTVGEADVSATFIGPSWGATVSTQALRALAIFLVVVSVAMAAYFRTWKMALAAMLATVHDLVITVGIYAWTGFEVSPATMIGFLTVLGYSLYDTVVVFDKVRENTAEAFAHGRMTYAEAANLAVNQTMVRSINTTVVAVLPIVAVLGVGIVALGPGTLLDLSLVLFVGIVAGAYSSIFIATPILVSLRAREQRVVDLGQRAERHEARERKRAAAERATADADAVPLAVGSATVSERGAGSTATGRAIHEYARPGPRNQPRRTPRSKR